MGRYEPAAQPAAAPVATPAAYPRRRCTLLLEVHPPQRSHAAATTRPTGNAELRFRGLSRRYRSGVSSYRRCSRNACADQATATLTYVYAESKALVGPLAQVHEPHHYDLCANHATRMTVPLGWDVVREPVDSFAMPPLPSADDLEALADAVREAARGDGSDILRRGHLRVLRSPS